MHNEYLYWWCNYWLIRGRRLATVGWIVEMWLTLTTLLVAMSSSSSWSWLHNRVVFYYRGFPAAMEHSKKRPPQCWASWGPAMLAGLWIKTVTGQRKSFRNLLPPWASKFTALGLLSPTVIQPFRVFPYEVWAVGLRGLFKVWSTTGHYRVTKISFGKQINELFMKYSYPLALISVKKFWTIALDHILALEADCMSAQAHKLGNPSTF